MPAKCTIQQAFWYRNLPCKTVNYDLVTGTGGLSPVVVSIGGRVSAGVVDRVSTTSGVVSGAGSLGDPQPMASATTNATGIERSKTRGCLKILFMVIFL